jgi:hypothetical protein
MTAETHPIDKELVMAYLDGELKPVQAARIAIHLDLCAECRELASELRGVSSLLLAWGVEPAPKQLDDVVTAALLHAEDKIGAKSEFGLADGKSSPKFAWKRLMQSKWTWATVGFATLCIAGLVSLRPNRQESVPRFASRGLDSLDSARSLMSSNLQTESLEEKASAPPASPPQAEVFSTGPMIARTASLNISIKDFDTTRAAMDRIVRAHQGYASSLNVSAEQGAPRSLDAKIAVPAAQYDATLADLRALGRVSQEQQSSEELSSQIIDQDARIKNAREAETQLAEIIRTRTGKVGDVLEVEQEMARVRGEIEVMEANQKHLHARVAFASIDLKLTEEYQAQLGGGSSFAGRQIRNALVDGYHAAGDGLLSVCVMLFSVAPSLLLWGVILLWPARWAWRRWQKSKAQSPVSA